MSDGENRIKIDNVPAGLKTASETIRRAGLAASETQNLASLEEMRQQCCLRAEDIRQKIGGGTWTSKALSTYEEELRALEIRLTDFDVTAKTLESAQLPNLAQRLSALRAELNLAQAEVRCSRDVEAAREELVACIQENTQRGPRSLSAEGLALHQGELLAFERRLAALEPAAHDLEGNHRPALRQRLSAIRTELQGKIVALQQTHSRNVVDEEIGKEARCRSDMEALYREFCASNDALWASRGQWGLTAQQLAAQMKVVADFDKRFSDFQLIGSTLKTGGDAFLARLAVLQQDVKGVSRVLGEMYASRIASDNNVAGIVAAGNQAAFESLTNINKGWRKTFKME